MKKVKRKYTRKPKQDALEPISSPVKEEVGISSGGIPEGMVIPDSVTTTSSVTYKEFSFNDLPLSLRVQVESVIKYRKRLCLPDDSKERKALAIRMFRGDRPR